jgi:hypothetical protein
VPLKICIASNSPLITASTKQLKVSHMGAPVCTCQNRVCPREGNAADALLSATRGRATGKAYGPNITAEVLALSIAKPALRMSNFARGI